MLQVCFGYSYMSFVQQICNNIKCNDKVDSFLVLFDILY